jgi:hypothetical protein
MTASLSAKSNGTQGALQVNGVDAVVFEAGGIASGYKAGSITPAALSGNQSGSAPAFAARAWCVFNGTLTGTNAPIAGGNIASIQYITYARWYVAFTTPMPDADYAPVVVGPSTINDTNQYYNSIEAETGSRTVNGFYIRYPGGAVTPAQLTKIQMAIFR